MDKKQTKYSRDKVCDIIYDLNHNDAHDRIKAEFEGLKYWEQEVQDIVDSIESVALAIEIKMKADWERRWEHAREPKEGTMRDSRGRPISEWKLVDKDGEIIYKSGTKYEVAIYALEHSLLMAKEGE